MSFLAGSRALCLQPALALCTGALRLRPRSAPALCVQRLLLRLSSALVLEIQMLVILQQAATLCACAPRRRRRQEQQGLRRRLQRLLRQRAVGEREQREHDAHDLDEGHQRFHCTSRQDAAVAQQLQTPGRGQPADMDDGTCCGEMWRRAFYRHAGSATSRHGRPGLLPRTWPALGGAGDGTTEASTSSRAARTTTMSTSSTRSWGTGTT